MSEYGEPWKYDGQFIVDESGRRVIGEDQCERCYLIDEDAERIVACVNACAGIPTADLDRASRFMPTLAGNLTAEQKAELLRNMETAGPLEIVDVPHGMDYRPVQPARRKEPPDKPGWWWLIGPKDTLPLRVFQEVPRGPLLVRWLDRDVPVIGATFAGSFWAGPIDPPTATEVTL